jgi:hypothetical protein
VHLYYQPSLALAHVTTLATAFALALTTSHTLAPRPTVINLYEEPMDSVDAWWAQWKTFVFDTTVNIKGKVILIFKTIMAISTSEKSRGYRVQLT